MKKIIVVMLLITVLVSFAACGKRLTQEEKEAAAIIAICDEYLNYEISRSECIEELDDLYLTTYLMDSTADNMIFWLERKEMGEFMDIYYFTKEYYVDNPIGY